MIQRLGMPKVMAPYHAIWGQDIAYHYLNFCKILLKKHNIITINMWNEMTKYFFYILTELE